MASLLKTRICPTCGAKALRNHCESSGCTWAVCQQCLSWGQDDGARWVDNRRKAG
jgi:hypothetical protein